MHCLNLSSLGTFCPTLLLFAGPLSSAVMQYSLFSAHTSISSQVLHELGLDFLFLLCQWAPKHWK